MNLRKMTAKASWTTLALLSLSSITSQHASALTEHNVPKGVEISSDRGRVAVGDEQTLTIILKMHNREGLDEEVRGLYDRSSPTFHKWLTDTQLAKYAPTAAEYESVRKELEGHGFKVVSADPRHFSIRVHGTTGIVENAFQTELHTFSHNGKVFQAHVRDAQLTGEAGKLVDSVVGLERRHVTPLAMVAKNPLTGKPLFKKQVTHLDAGSTLLGEITGTPLTAPTLFTYNTYGSALPLGVYYGSVYDVNENLVVSYTPKELQGHYALTSLIKEGYDGTGQTIALVEAYGYDSAEADANLAAAAYGLPPLDSSNFETIYPEGKPLNPTAVDLEGWTVEIALDIQSAHAIAPGAKIVVVASAGQDNEDQIASLQYIIDNKVASTASSSWENDAEIVSGAAEEDAFNSVLELGAAAGVSFQFSSGDGGDLGLGTPDGAVSVPSNSPYATAVGGTSILNNPNGTDHVTTGWGNSLLYIAEGGPVDPPTGNGFFYAGAGGGKSLFFAKPSYQWALPGSGRQVPDVSALADPFTGFGIIFTDQGFQYVLAGVGGTSLASPIFTAIWAIADQYNGGPLGQAGPAAAALKPGQIRDVVPTSDLFASDVTGTIYDSSGATFYSADDLFTGLRGTQLHFVTAVWPFDSEDALVLSFGTDSSLTVSKGWDNVTGYGEPNGLPFIQGVTGKTTGAAIAKKK